MERALQGILKTIKAFLILTALVVVELKAQRVVGGTVTDEHGLPLIGANVLVKDGAAGTTTDVDGNFSLTLPADARTLIVSYIGFSSTEVEVGSEDRIEVILITTATTLQEIVKWGYGTSTRRKLTSSIASIDEEVYLGAAKTNAFQALQGRVPGVQISEASGATQTPMNIRIRGQTSINASNQPLIVIDGVITDTWGGHNYVSAGANNLLGIDPNNIASIEVLKDGAASAIYGARGSNGILLITTKQGQFNTAPKVTLSYQIGASNPSVRQQAMTGPEFARSWNQAAAAVGITDTSFLYANPDAEPTTDWYDLLTRTAVFHDIHASVSGGDQSTNYHIAGGYRSDEDYFITKGMRRYSIQAKINQMIGERWQVGVSISPTRLEQDRFFETGRLSEAPTISSLFPPNLPAFDADGDPLLLNRGKISTFRWNPIVELRETKFKQDVNEVRMGTHLQYAPAASIQLRTEFNVEYSGVEVEEIKGANTRVGGPINGQIFSEAYLTSNYNWTNTLTWTAHHAANDELVVVAGSQLQRHAFKHVISLGENFADPALRDIDAAAFTLGGGRGEGYRFAGFFLRANYSLRNKYFLAASARYDGSSRFGQNNRWGFFPSLSAGWMISEESFFDVGAFDFVKLSASIGQTGNAEISNFGARALLGFSSSYDGEPGSSIDALGNTELSWEETTQYNVSLSFALWRQQVEGTLTWFRKTTDGLLLQVPIPSTNGVGSLFQNVGSLYNMGVEFELTSQLVRSSDLSIKVGVNGAHIRNKITALADTDGDGEDNDISTFAARHRLQIFRVGEPLGSWYMVRSAGVDPANGDALFLDVEGNKTNVLNDNDRVIVGNAFPKFTGGMSFEIDYKRFYLSANFQSALGFHAYRHAHNREDWAGEFNVHRNLLNAWREDNPDTDIPQSRLFRTNGTQYQITRWLEKGDYLRLKQLQVGHRFLNLGQRNSSLTVYMSGTNLWLLTGVPDDMDPELMNTQVDRPTGAAFDDGISLPRTISVGVKLEL